MTNQEIRKYLELHDYTVKSQDGVTDIFNTSPQITGWNYDHLLGTMTIYTPDEIFSFKWILKKLG